MAAFEKRKLFDDMGSLNYFESSHDAFSESSKLFLDAIDIDGLEALVVKSGLDRFLENKKLRPYTLHISRDDSGVHSLDIVYEPQKSSIIKLKLSKKRFIDSEYSKDVSLDMIMIEWLSTRNPFLTEFQSKRPQLPGQSGPSLGCLKQLLVMMYLFSKCIANDGFMDVPDHLHLAMMYSRKFLFFDPGYELHFRKLMEELRRYPLADIAWASVTGAIIKDSHTPYQYKPSEQMFPVSNRLKSYFRSKHYHHTLKEKSETQYSIDYTILQKVKAELLAKHEIGEL